VTVTPAAPRPPAQLADDVADQVRRWLAAAEKLPADPSARRLAGLLQDPAGLDFAVGFVDGVIRPEDTRVAARTLSRLARRPPAFLSAPLRGAIRLGGALAPAFPGIVVPLARRVLRGMVAHLVIDANDPRLGRAIRRIRERGARPNVNLLGEAVLGPREAQRRLDGTMRLLARDDVDYVSIKVSATVAPHSPWAFDEAVADISEALAPLFRHAAASPTPKFINLDMEEYKDLDLTIAVFQRILDEPDLRGLEAGIVLQAYLPDALGAMVRLQEWAAARRAAGGSGIKVRLVKGANLPMERVDASLHDWPLATWHSKQESDTNYKRVLDYALRPERIENVRMGVAGHNLFDLAFARLLATERGVAHGVEFEMLLGMAPAQAEAVRRDVGALLLYTPVVAAADFDSAIAYLIRRLEEGASQDNFMSAVFELARSAEHFEREHERFLRSLAELDDRIPEPHRVQDRTSPAPEEGPGFHNAPDTDPSVAANRAWGRAVLERARTSERGADLVAASTVRGIPGLDAVIGRASAAAAGWAALGAAGRAAILHRAGELLEARRGDLVETMASETGKTLDQGDTEVSEAVDYARFYADRAEELDRIDGARYAPTPVTAVIPPWNFPLAIPAGSTLAALASGSATILKPSRRAARVGALLAEALWDAGVPRDVLQLLTLEDSGLGSRLVSDPRVGQVVLTGGYETAESFRDLRPDLKLLAETSGKNAIVVTPSADLDLAARDLAYSAFSHAGQKCSAASLAILVGSVARSGRFRQQLLDAVDAMTVGPAWEAPSRIGPLIAPADGKLLRALTELQPGEAWLREPRRLDEKGMLWSPGVKTVRAGGEFHRVEYFGPVLGILEARDLDEAIALQNAVDYGLTAGLHSLDPDEIATWVDRVEAGNLYVNRGTTGAIVRRQPFGGWKRSVVGPTTKAGGPSYLFGLGSFSPARAAEPAGERLSPAIARVVAAFGADPDDLAMLHRAAASDARAWRDEFGVSRDVSQLTAERNAFRYRPLPVTIHAAEGATPAQVARVVVAGLAAGAPLVLSTAAEPSAEQRAALGEAGVAVRVEDERGWIASLPALRDARVRLVGASGSDLLVAVGGRPDLTVYDGAPTEAGRVELLPFLREQAISITAHRFGTPSGVVEAVPLTA